MYRNTQITHFFLSELWQFVPLKECRTLAIHWNKVVHNMLVPSFLVSVEMSPLLFFSGNAFLLFFLMSLAYQDFIDLNKLLMSLSFLRFTFVLISCLIFTIYFFCLNVICSSLHSYLRYKLRSRIWELCFSGYIFGNFPLKYYFCYNP